MRNRCRAGAGSARDGSGQHRGRQRRQHHRQRIWSGNQCFWRAPPHRRRIPEPGRLWRNEISPVYPDSRLERPVAAMARPPPPRPVLTVRPSACMANGSSTSAKRADAQRPIGLRAPCAHSELSIRSPSRPRGRNSSPRNISTYMEASPAAGRTKWMVMPRNPRRTRSAGQHHAQKLAEPADHTTRRRP